MQNIKNPNPKAALPLDLARTKSAPPEGKIAEFGALLNNKINISNTNPVSNQQKQEKKLNIKSQEFFIASGGNPTDNNNQIPTPFPPIEIKTEPTTFNNEQKVFQNIKNYNERSGQLNQSNSLTESKEQGMKSKLKKMNLAASSFVVLTGGQTQADPQTKTEWDQPIAKPQIPPTLSKPQLSKPSNSTKPGGVLKTGANLTQNEIGLEKIDEEIKKEDDHSKELHEKERRETKEKEQKEKELAEKEQREKEQRDREQKEKELKEKEQNELREKELKEKELKEQEEKENLEREQEEKERFEKEQKDIKEKEEKQKKNDNLGISVTQKSQSKVTKQYLISLIETGRKTFPPIPEYLKVICLRDVQVDRKVPGGSGAGGNKRPTYSQPQPSNEPKFERGTHVKTSEIQQNNEEKFTRNTVDPKYKEIKSKENLWTEAKIKEKKQDPKKLLENNIRAFLNILTPDNFDVIKDGILDLARPSHENIDLLVQKVIEKAWVEPKYIETYAKLCFFLQNEKSLTFPDQEKKSTEPGSKKKSTNPFKSKLLEKIQKAFETEEVTDQKQKEKYEKMTPEEKEFFKKIKMNKILGNVKFIGELHLQKVIPQKVIHICACSMFEKFQKEYFKTIGEGDLASEDFEYNLEGIIKLFDRVGKLYDKDRDKEMSSDEKAVLEKCRQQFYDLEKLKKTSYETIFGDEEEKITTNGIFKLLEFVRDNIRFPTKKIQTLIDNLLDRRENDWKDKLLSKEGPKTIHELHKEYFKEIEEAERRLENSDVYDNRSSNRGGNRGGQQMIYVEKKNQNQNPVFQVHSEKKNERVEEEKKEYNADKKIKLDFTMDRSKNASKSILKDSKISKSDVETAVKLIIKKLDEKRDEEKDGEYTEKHAFEELLALSQKASHSDIISRFLHDYYDGPPSEVEKRVTIPYRLVSEGGMKKEDFLKEFGLSLSKVWSNVSDFPNLLSSMSKVFFEFIKKDLVKYNEIEIDWTGGMEKATDDISEEIQFVLKDFVEVSCKLLKEKEFFEKKEEEIIAFLPKIKLPDISSWYEKMKKSF